MNILVIGSGGREHAIVYALSKSESSGDIYCSPGNPGIFQIAKKTDINSSDFNEVSQFCKKKKIDLVVIGPEQPLAEGITDYLKIDGINAFGPSKSAARLESSKEFAKGFMWRNNIPTAKFKSFVMEQRNQAHDFIHDHQLPVVIKADGLAAGKGVVIAETYEMAHITIDSMFSGLYKEAGKKIVIEEYLYGEEVSILAITDGFDYITLAPSQDHKRAFDNDLGKNTGGMGAHAPASLIDDILMKKIKKRIIEPTINSMNKEGYPFKGCLYAGLMIKDNEPYVIEFNVRFGDPETQAVLTLFEGDFANLLYSSAIGKLDKKSYNEVNDLFSCCVVMASTGYPDKYGSGYTIQGIKDVESDGGIVFHAGTREETGNIVTSGGRVLGVCGLGHTLKEAIDTTYHYVGLIHFDNSFYRKDIGLKGLNK